MKNIKITSPFWNKYQQLITKEVLPYQWDVMNNKDIEMAHEPGGNDEHLTHSFAIENLEIAAGLKSGKHHGYPFQDTDVYKWLEAVAYTLKYNYDEQTIELTDNLIDLIAQAQVDDGYLVTFFQIKAPERKFARLKQSHELYTMGHFIEAAVAYYEVTNNEKALKIALNMADCIANNFGNDLDKIRGADGHPEIELALARLYELTKIEKYLDLAKFFIEVRGQDDFFDQQLKTDGINREMIDSMRTLPLSYYQAHKPISAQDSAEGHAVRMVYLCTGIAKVARLSNNQEFKDICQRFWRSIVDKKMYITGAIGSTNIGESFTGDYDLPNDTMYGETCASVAMAFFANEMLKIKTDGEYADILEKELFNGILSRISLDGTHFFYVNPLECDPDISKHNPSRNHVLTSRAEWFGCACCPSNVARLIASIDQYIYTENDNTILCHQFIANKAEFNHNFMIEQTSNFPWDNQISFTITNNSNTSKKLGIRIPKWSSTFKITVDNQEIKPNVIDGFIYLEINQQLCHINLELEMAVKLYAANPNVKYNVQKVAIMRGPIVYCAEKIDQETDVWKYQLTNKSSFTCDYHPNLLNGTTTIKTNALINENNKQELYYEYQPNIKTNATLTLIPYYAWANRNESQMAVWINFND